METRTIYGLVDPRNNEIRYIGKAWLIKYRLWQHIKCHDSNLIKREWIKELKREKKNPLLMIIEEVPVWNSMERERW